MNLQAITVVILTLLLCTYNAKLSENVSVRASKAWLLLSQETKAAQVRWNPLGYQGLIPGKSTKADVKRKFGKPLWAGPFEEEGSKYKPDANKSEELYEYQDVAGFKGRITIVFDARYGRTRKIWLYPQHLSLQQVMEKYGNSYVERASKLGPCPGKKEVAKFKPPQKKEFPRFLVYPHLGMYLSVGEDSLVKEIGYLSFCQMS